MNVAEATQTIEGKLMAGRSALEKEIQGGYASDLLSDVMGNSREGDIWITMQKHVKPFHGDELLEKRQLRRRD